MTARIDIVAPATISVLGSSVSSLNVLPPGGITLNDPNSGTLTLTLVASNGATVFSASGASGATISSAANTLTITGLQAQVNAALASLTITEPVNTGTDTVLLTATSPGVLTAQTDIAVSTNAATGPAFTAPPATIALQPYSLTSIGGLLLSDPAADALAATGQGRSEILALTLSAASGVLLLPGLAAQSGVIASGIGTSQIILTFTAGQIATVNSLLAGLDYAAPAAISDLAYALRDVSGPLGPAITSGNIVLNIAGTQTPAATVISGPDTAILGPARLAAGTTLNIAGITSNLGGINGGAAVFIHPDAALEVPYNTLSLSGTSFDFGTLGAFGLNEAGSLIIAGGAGFGGPVNLGTSGFIDFAGTLIAASQAQTLGQPGLSLAAGALLTGSGAVVAGNFSESGNISGPGTIQVESGETLLIAANSISGTHLDVAAGGVLELGPLDPLFGVFDATPLTVASSVTLAFQSGGGNPVTGKFADTLAEPGGVIVIESPDIFAGTIIGFAPGDRLVFPTLSGLTLLSVTSASFVVAGTDTDNITQSYSFQTNYPAGTQLYVSTDAGGDSAISLRDSVADVFLNGATADVSLIMATPGIAQPIPGLDVLLRSWTTQSLTLTLAVAHGLLSDDGRGPAPQLTITAASPTALDSVLADLVYTGNTGAVSDNLNVAGNTGLLFGLTASIPIALGTVGGTVSGFGNAGQVALFSGTAIAQPYGNAATPGEMIVTGTADFANKLAVNGLSGTALKIDAGGTGIFDAAANVSLRADAVIGDANGPGQLDIITQNFFSSGNMTLGTASGAEISGALYLSGSLLIGAASLELAGNLSAGAVSIGTSGTLAATGNARANLGGLNEAGQFTLRDAAAVSAASLALTGTLALGGTSAFALGTGALIGGMLNIGPDAVFSAGSFEETGGSILLAGILSLASGLTADTGISLGGGTLIAPSLTLDPGANLSGGGIIEARNGLGTLMAGGAILATGALILGDNISISNGGSLVIGAAASLDVVHAANGGTVSFAGAGAELIINDVAQFSLTVTGLLDHDGIDLIGAAPSLVSFANGSLTVSDQTGHALGGFALSIASGQPGLEIISDSHGGAMITFQGDMPCFARGTRLLTPNGYKAVEGFSPGDPVITQYGARRAVRWVGRRTLDFAKEKGGYPVRFAAHALGPGIPARPVVLSPLHAVFVSGVLVPALHLVNGATITTMEKAAVTYYHIELDWHDVVLADGMPAETYLDNGNRGQLYHETGKRGSCRTACAPLVTGGAQLAEIRRTLHSIALQAGYTLTYQPALRGVSASQSLLPEITLRAGRRAVRFKVPQNARQFSLTARCATPADTNPDSEDRRRLGICLRQIMAGRRMLPVAAHLGTGWLSRAPDDAGIWMGSAGEILNLPPGIRSLSLDLAAVIQRWEPPECRMISS